MIDFYQIVNGLVGLGIAWAVRWRWDWALLAGIAAGLALYGIHDWVRYGDPFDHSEHMAIQALEFGGWATLFCLLRPYLAILRRDNF